jgi:hypothetical protein
LKRRWLRLSECQTRASLAKLPRKRVEGGLEAVARAAGIGCVCSWARVSTDVPSLHPVFVRAFIRSRRCSSAGDRLACVVTLEPAAGAPGLWSRFRAGLGALCCCGGSGTLYLFRAPSAFRCAVKLRPAAWVAWAVSPWAPATNPGTSMRNTSSIWANCESQSVDLVRILLFGRGDSLGADFLLKKE